MSDQLRNWRSVARKNLQRLQVRAWLLFPHRLYYSKDLPDCLPANRKTEISYIRAVSQRLSSWETNEIGVANKGILVMKIIPITLYDSIKTAQAWSSANFPNSSQIGFRQFGDDAGD